MRLTNTMAVRDIKYAWRALTTTPGLAVVVVLTLAVGLGAAAATFGVVNAVLLRPLPVREPGRLIVLTAQDRTRPDPHVGIPQAALHQFVARARTVSGLAAVHSTGASPMAFRDGGAAVTLATTPVANLFSVLGAPAAVGRLLGPDDEAPGALGTLVLSHSAWRREFSGDSGVVNRSLNLGSRRLTIVGVAPVGLEYPRGVDAWVPMSFFSPSPIGGDPDAGFPSDVVARLRTDATLAQAQSEFSQFLRAYPSRRLGAVSSRSAVASSLTTVMVGSLRPALIVLSVAVTLVVIAALVNVAGLLLTRGLARSPEFAIRAALGAGRSRIMTQLATEHLLLTAAGAALSIGTTALLLRVGIAVAPAGLARFDEVRMDLAVLGFVAMLAAVAMLAVGLAPAVSVSRRDLGAALRRGSATVAGAGGTERARHTVIAGQVALAVVVLTGAGLLGRTVLNLQRLDLGFDPEPLVFVALDISPPASADRAEYTRLGGRWQATMDALQHRLPGQAGITAMAGTLAPPFSSGGVGGTRPSVPYILEGQQAADTADTPAAELDLTSGAYFRTFGIRLIHGRELGPEDNFGTVPVAVVSEALARQAWPGQDALGQRIRVGRRDTTWRTVVGIAEDTRYSEVVGTQRPTVYVPARQYQASPSGYIALRTTAKNPGDVLPAVHRLLREVEPWSAVRRVALGRDLLDQVLAQPRFVAAVLAVLSFAAALVAAVGLFSALAAVVRQRSGEFAVRLALGASPAKIRQLVLRHAVRVAGLGVAIGLVAALLGMRVLRAQLFGVSPADPVTLAAVVAFLLAVATGAAYLPARRAAHADPLAALRHGDS